MKLLKDDELRGVIRAGGLVEDDELMNAANQPTWNDKRSPIQPASLDLHIGQIFIPGTPADQRGGADNPETSRHSLMPGETAIVTTRERLKLPSDIAGFGFPPSHVSIDGILMTNPGHVDPGYHGRMRFTLIHMGKKPYELRSGDPVVTVLFVKLSGDVDADYAMRRQGHLPDLPPRDTLTQLSRDFLDITERATGIADNAVLRAQVVVKELEAKLNHDAAIRNAWIVGGLAVVAAIAGAIITWKRPASQESVQQLQSKVDQLQTQAETKAEVDKIKEDLSRIEKRLATMPVR